jgi:hypothetical protein
MKLGSQIPRRRRCPSGYFAPGIIRLTLAIVSEPQIPLRYASGIIRPANFSALRFSNLGLIKNPREVLPILPGI